MAEPDPTGPAVPRAQVLGEESHGPVRRAEEGSFPKIRGTL